jgi:hypothetical protein
MTPRQRVRIAMELGVPDQVPVQCQMATGHILLNSGVDPIAEATDSAAFADSLVAMRDRYDFDGILIHKPGREPGWLDDADRAETADGWIFTFADGSRVRIQRDDDPVFVPRSGWSWPELDAIDPARPLAAFTGPHARWHRFKGTHPYHRVEDIPDHWYAVIDRIRDRTADAYSLHGETRGPFDHVLNLVGVENMMIALHTARERLHALLDWATQSSITWSVAQVRHGCDAIKISEPFVGAGFISRPDYDEFVVPYTKRLCDAVRAAGGFIYAHTCGRIGDRIESMAASGVSGLECLDPPPLGDVEIEDAVRRTKGKLFIKGNVDAVHTMLEKDVAGVRADVQRVVNAAAPGGGFICSTACSIAPRVPPENVETLVTVARDYKY